MFSKYLWLLAACWLVTPGGLILVGLIGENRLIPLFNPRKQFLSFMPGDLFLGVTVAWLLYNLLSLQPGHWYLSRWWYVIILIVALLVAILITKAEYDTGFFPVRAILSPTKIYHNFILYAGYGSVAVFALIAGFASGSWVKTLVAIIPATGWIAMLLIEPNWPEHANSTRCLNAHITNWQVCPALRNLFGK